MTEEQLNKLRQVAVEATSGPWHVDGNTGDLFADPSRPRIGRISNGADASFIIDMRDHAIALIDSVIEAREDERAYEAHICLLRDKYALIRKFVDKLIDLQPDCREGESVVDAVMREVRESRAALAKQKEEAGYPHLMRAFADQEEEIKRLKAELAEAVRLGDERLVTLWDDKKNELKAVNEELKAANETIDMLYERSGRFAAQADKYEQELKEAKAAILRVQSRLDDALALLSAKSAQLEAVLAKRLELGGDLEAADLKGAELQERSAWFEAERHKDQLRLKSAEDEIIRLRRHLGEIP